MTTEQTKNLGASSRLASLILALSLLAVTAAAQPSILVQPESQTNPPGFTVFFGVGAQNAASYQWDLNAQPISGAGYVISNEALTIISAQPTNTGPYTVIVSNSSGSVTSAPVNIMLSNAPVQAPSIRYQALASFNQSTTGAFPQTGLIQGADGYLYGVTLRGGANDIASGGDGTVFKLSTNGVFAWNFSFNRADGYAPVGGLAQDTNGMFYGTTAGGGLDGYGTVFSISPAGAYKLLHSFTNNTDGGNPQCTLCIGSDGYLYGDTSTNQAGNLGGTVFKMDTNGNQIWSTLLTTNTGDIPLAGLVQAADGYFYGTASADGGTNSSGSVFQVTGSGAVANIYAFTGGDDGGEPVSALIVGTNGLLYGTTSEGGTFGYGTIFAISTNGTLATLYSFDGTNGMSPQAGVLMAADGNFYGTTSDGGIEHALNFGANFQVPSGYPDGFGTIYQMTPAGRVTTMISLNGNSTGAYSHSTVWQGREGGLYGTTANGGTNDLDAGGDGLVFRLSISNPVITSVMRHGTNFSFQWNSAIGELYQVQYKDSLPQSPWLDLGPPISGTNGVGGDSDTITPTNKTRFYRVLLQY